MWQGCRQTGTTSLGPRHRDSSSPPPPQIQSQITPHAIIFLPNTDGMEMLLCYEDEGVYVNTYGRIIKDVVLQWGEMPTSVGKRGVHPYAVGPQPGPGVGLGSSPLTGLQLLSPPAYICSNQIMGWGEKAIEIRSVETGHLDGVFMHKRAQRLKFLCERNDKVGASCPLERPRPLHCAGVHNLRSPPSRGQLWWSLSEREPMGNTTACSHSPPRPRLGFLRPLHIPSP